MNICLKKTIAQIDHCLPGDGIVNIDQLRKMYDLTLRQQSQLLSVIYDMEIWILTDYNKSEASHEDQIFGKTMRFRKCHGKQSKAQNLCLPWTSINHDALLIGHKIRHGEADMQRGSARSVCLGRRDEQNS